jgi:hypothetical protein
MSRTLTPYDQDIVNFAEAIAHFPELAVSDKNWETVRLHLVTVKQAFKPGFMGVPVDLYVGAIAALRSQLEKKEAPKPAYRPGQLFPEDIDEPVGKKELAPLPPDRDPFRMQIDQDRAEQIDEIFREFTGRNLSPSQKLHEVKRAALDRLDSDLRDVNVTIYAGHRVNRAATERARKEAREHNAAVLAARQAAKSQGAL